MDADTRAECWDAIQRWGEDEAVEFMRHLRAEVGEVLSWHEEVKALMAARSAAVPEYLKKLI